MAKSIDFAALGLLIRQSPTWPRPVDMRTELGLSQSTTMDAWHGRSIGLLPFLQITKALRLEPYDFMRDSD